MKAIIAVPVTLVMIYRAHSHGSLTPGGIAAATLTAIAHAVHPWNLPFGLLIIFFIAGTSVTKVKKNIKEKLTLQSTGNAGGEGARTHVQVFANSGVASVLTLLHAYQLYKREQSGVLPAGHAFPWERDILVIGIIANYAAVAADTFSSELGILAESPTRLITSLDLRKVPKGTNGGVTWEGLVAGLGGSFVIVTASMALSFTDAKFPSITPWGLTEPTAFRWGMIIWGGLGSVLDSVLGGLFQASVVDTRTGRIVEGDGGKKVLVSKPGQGGSMHQKKLGDVKASLLNGEGEAATEVAPQDIGKALDKKMGATDKYNDQKQLSTKSEQPSRKIESGLGLLDNNDVNFLMALTMSLGAMAIAGFFWGKPFDSILNV